MGIDLRRNGFKAISELKGESGGTTEEKGEDEADAEEDDGSGEDWEGDAPDATKKAVKDFEYLVGMPISTLTAEKVAKLMQEQERKASHGKGLAALGPLRCGCPASTVGRLRAGMDGIMSLRMRIPYAS
eukprot:Skav232212  [mRNA]  locus=scaffold2626:354059:358239:+ [translate_table: standard]